MAKYEIITYSRSTGDITHSSACIPRAGTLKPPCAPQVTPKIPACRIYGTARSITRK